MSGDSRGPYSHRTRCGFDHIGECLDFLDKVSQVTTEPFHYQTDIVLVTTAVDSHKAHHIRVLQLAQNTALLMELSHNKLLLPYAYS